MHAVPLLACHKALHAVVVGKGGGVARDAVEHVVPVGMASGDAHPGHVQRSKHPPRARVDANNVVLKPHVCQDLPQHPLCLVEHPHAPGAALHERAGDCSHRAFVDPLQPIAPVSEQKVVPIVREAPAFPSLRLERLLSELAHCAHVVLDCLACPPCENLGKALFHHRHAFAEHCVAHADAAQHRACLRVEFPDGGVPVAPRGLEQLTLEHC